MDDFQTLARATYVSLRTFRKSGKPVATPVWCAPSNGALFVFSAGEAGKVKRLRLSDEAELALCDIRGKLLGSWIPAQATLLTQQEDINQALAALRKKYGWQMRIADIGAKLTGKMAKRAYIKIMIKPAATLKSDAQKSDTPA